MTVARATVEIRVPVSSAMMNAAAPRMGGVICPPVEATASTAEANRRVADLDHHGDGGDPEATTLAAGCRKSYRTGHCR